MTYVVIYQIITGVNYFLNIVSGLIVVYCIMSWVARPDSPIYIFVQRVTSPVLDPFRNLSRRLINRGMRFDVAPILAIIAIRIIRYIINTVLLRFI